MLLIFVAALLCASEVFYAHAEWVFDNPTCDRFDRTLCEDWCEYKSNGGDSQCFTTAELFESLNDNREFRRAADSHTVELDYDDGQPHNQFITCKCYKDSYLLGPNRPNGGRVTGREFNGRQEEWERQRELQEEREREARERREEERRRHREERRREREEAERRREREEERIQRRKEWERRNRSSGERISEEEFIKRQEQWERQNRGGRDRDSNSGRPRQITGGRGSAPRRVLPSGDADWLTGGTAPRRTLPSRDADWLPRLKDDAIPHKIAKNDRSSGHIGSGLPTQLTGASEDNGAAAPKRIQTRDVNLWPRLKDDALPSRVSNWGPDDGWQSRRDREDRDDRDTDSDYYDHNDCDDFSHVTCDNYCRNKRSGRDGKCTGTVDYTARRYRERFHSIALKSEGRSYYINCKCLS